MSGDSSSMVWWSPPLSQGGRLRRQPSARHEGGPSRPMGGRPRGPWEDGRTAHRPGRASLTGPCRCISNSGPWTPQCSSPQTGSAQTSAGDQEPHLGLLGGTACGRGVLHQIAPQELREGTGPYTQHAARHPCTVVLFTQTHTHKHHSRKLACSVPPVPWIRS